MTYFLLALIGIIGGLVSGLFGVGGGVVFVPLLILSKAFDPHLAVGTSLAIVVPTALMATLKHHQGGMVDWKTALMMFVFAMVGAWIGAKVSLQMDAVVLRKGFALFLIAVALKLFFTK